MQAGAAGAPPKPEEARPSSATRSRRPQARPPSGMGSESGALVPARPSGGGNDALFLSSSLRMARPQWARLQERLACWSSGRWARARSRGVWEWLPAERAGCVRLPRLSRGSLCAALRGRSVLVVGDSLSRQMHMAILGLMEGEGRGAARARCPWRLSGVPCGGHAICRGGARRARARQRLLFRRSDWLRPNATAPFSFSWGANLVEEPWRADAASGAWGVLLLNRGAHLQAEDGAFREGWRAALAAARAAAPGALIVARNTPPGHAGCARARQPLTRRTPPPPPPHSPHGWHHFPRQNEVLRALLRKDFPGVLLLDVAAPTAGRPDMHLGSAGKSKDCLHYHLGPGSPLEHWVRLLAAVLKLAQSMAEKN